jgi:hypothetical protein
MLGTGFVDNKMSCCPVPRPFWILLDFQGVDVWTTSRALTKDFLDKNSKLTMFRYMTAIWVSIASHILIIAIVALFTLYFRYANRKQKKGTLLLERTVGFRYTY